MQISWTKQRRIGHTVFLLMPAVNNNSEIEKRRIAISSSSERDKCILSTDTPCRAPDKVFTWSTVAPNWKF